METLELSSWCPTGGQFRQPEKFGVARIGANAIHSIAASQPVLGNNDITATVVNSGPVPLALSATLIWSQQGAPGGTAEHGPLTLAPKQTRQIKIQYRVATTTKPVRLQFEVKRADTSAALGEYELMQDVQPALAVRLGRSVYELGESVGTAQIDVAVAADVSRGAALTLSLSRSGTAEPLRVQRLTEIAGNRLVARLDLAGLPAGEYELTATLAQRDKRFRLATGASTITKVRGPFDQ